LFAAMNRIAKFVGLAGWERKRDEGSRNGCAATAGLSIKKFSLASGW
jgi:hypothetical protein